MDGMLGGSITAILIGVWATFALDVFSTLNSSPQTTELFAKDRQDSLMHWVIIGSGVAIAGGGVATMLSGKPWPLIATVIVAGGMYYSYVHAISRGANQAPPSNAS
jgi:membrane protein YqaA with SNARE-associated domain